MEKISILGSGWLGLPLAIFLKQKDYEVMLSCRTEKKAKELSLAGFEAYVVDISLPINQIDAFLKTDILIINIPHKNSDDFKELIKQIEMAGLKKVLFISSTSVYDSMDEVVTEETTRNSGKLVEIENLFLKNTDFDTTLLRFGGLIGYSRNPANFFSSGKEIPNPYGYVNLIHRDDCIGIIEQIIEQGISNETFNACADTHPRRIDFYSKVAKKQGKQIPTFSKDKKGTYKIISNKKVKQKLNYSFIYSL